MINSNMYQTYNPNDNKQHYPSLIVLLEMNVFIQNEIKHFFLCISNMKKIIKLKA